jgi:phage-related minor tail protein
MAAAGRRSGEGGGEGLMSGLLSKGAAITAGVAAIGAAAGAALMAGLQEAMDQDKITDKLQASLGASDEVAKKAGKAAGDLYTNGVVDTFQEGADAIGQVMSSGLAPPDATNAQLEEVATKVSDVAKTFDQDLGGTANAVGQMMRTGMAKNATEALDLITRGFQNVGPNGADDLLDTLNEYGVQFQGLGLDGEDAMGIIVQAMKGGARNTDLAADALKEFRVRAINLNDTNAQEGFKALGLNAEDMAKKVAGGGSSAKEALQQTIDKLKLIKDPAKQATVSAMLFGTQSEDMAKALLGIDPSKATSALGQVGGSAKKMGDTLRDNASTRIDVFKRKIQEGFVQALGQYAIPAIDRFTQYVNSHFGPSVKTVTDKLGGLFSKAKSGSSSLGPLQSGFTNAMAGVKSAMGGAVSFVKTEFMPWFREQLPKIKPVVQQLSKTIGAVMTAIGDYIKDLVKVASYIWKKFGGTIKSVASQFFGGALGVIKGVLKAVQGVMQVFSGILTGNWKKVWTGLKNIISGLKGAIVSAFKGILGGLLSAGKGIIKGMGSIGKDIVMGLVHGITSLGSYVASRVKSFVTDHIPNSIKKVLGIASPSKVTKELGKWAGMGLVVGMTGTAAKVKSTAKKIADAIHKAIKGSSGKTKSALKKLSDVISADNKKLLGLAKTRDKIAARLKAAQTKLSDLKKAKADYAANIKNNIIGSSGFMSTDDGSTVSTGSILDKLKTAAIKAQKFAQNLAALKAKGVSTALIDQIAQQGVEGGSEAAAALASGTPEQIKAINDQQAKLASAATKAGSVASKAMYDNGINAAKGLVKGLTKQKKAIEKTMLDIAKSMVKAIKKALGIKSPSKVMAKIGDWTAEGFIRAIHKRMRDAEIAGAGLGWAAHRGAAKRNAEWQNLKDHIALEASTAVANASGSDAAYVNGNSKTTLPAIINVHVAGHVTTEKDLAKVISGHVRDEFIRLKKRNGGRDWL